MCQSPYQWTPLHFAVREGQEFTVKSLVESGANVSSKDNDGVNTYVPTDGVNVGSIAGLSSGEGYCILLSTFERRACRPTKSKTSA